MSSTTIYLKLPQVKEVYEPEVYLGMIADVHSSDRAAEAKAKAVKITSFSGKGKEAVFVGNVMELVEKIEKTGQNIQVDNIGESDFVVTYRAGKKKSLVWEWMKTAMVSAVAFFGAAFAIMTFNNDANVTDVFAKLYEMIIGTRADGPTITWISCPGFPANISRAFSSTSGSASIKTSSLSAMAHATRLNASLAFFAP